MTEGKKEREDSHPRFSFEGEAGDLEGTFN